MTQKIEKMLRIIAGGFACSARAAAFREGLPWDQADLRRRRRPPQRP